MAQLQLGRRNALRLLAASVGAAWAAPAVIAASRAGAATPTPGSTGVFTIPAGTPAQISDVVLGGCNLLVAGYELDAIQTDLVNNWNHQWPNDCSAVESNGTLILPALRDRLLRIYLRDVTCGPTTYYSDDTPAAHATVTGDGPWQIGVVDAGARDGNGRCRDQARNRPDGPGGNLVLTLTIG